MDSPTVTTKHTTSNGTDDSASTFEQDAAEMIASLEKQTIEVSDSNAHIEKMLAIFHDVKNRLVKAGLTELAGEWPIKQSQYRQLPERDYLGFCHADHEDWYIVSDTLKRSRKNSVAYVEVRLKDTNGRFFKIEAVLPTLLHEFAHCITSGEMHYGHDESGKRSRKWHYVAHCDAFYDNFARILQLAEKLQIFSLPPTPNKLSRKNLKRYDAIDLEVVPSYAIGSTTLYANDLPPPPGEEESQQAEKKKSPALRLIVCGPRGIRKPIFLEKKEDRTLDALFAAAAQKLRIPKPKRALTLQGVPLTDDLIEKLENDTVVTVS